jgi:DNA-binding NarL/FixJ family response regulator
VLDAVSDLVADPPAGDNARQKSDAGAMLLLIDDHALRRAALERLLEDRVREDDLALTVVAEPSPDRVDGPGGVRLVLLSIGGSPTPVAVIEDLSRRMQEVPVVVLSDRTGTVDVVAALKAGARGFVTSHTDPRVVVRALKFIICGGVVFPPEALQGCDDARDAPPVQASPQPDPQGPPGLTPRQGGVLNLLQRGLSNKQIGRALGMCEATVKVHVRQIMHKLGVANRTQAALLARSSLGYAAPQSTSP